MTTPAGWYPDPAGDPTLVRYWDGAGWTDHLQPMVQEAAVPEPPAPAPAPAPTPPPPAPTPAPTPAPPGPGAPPAPGAPGGNDGGQPPSPSQPGPPVDFDAGGIRTELLTDERYREVDSGIRVVKQNSKLLRVTLGEPILARQGSMVAFQGSVDFDYEGSGGMGKFLKKAMTGEGVPLMRCTGQGEVFLADSAKQIHILHLEGAGLSVNGKNILAFEPSLQWSIERVQGAGMMTGGLFNTQLSGHGWVAITTNGEPVVLRTDVATYADPDAAVAWSSNLTTSLNKTVKAKAMIGRGSGEAFQLAFGGQGIVVVQPAEGDLPAHTHGN